MPIILSLPIPTANQHGAADRVWCCRQGMVLQTGMVLQAGVWCCRQGMVLQTGYGATDGYGATGRGMVLQRGYGAADRVWCYRQGYGATLK